MPEKCEVCKQRFEPEPGFYYGAMYISYILNVFLFLINFVIFGFYFPLSVFSFCFLYSIQVISVMPVVFRYARAIYIYIFVPFDPSYSEK
ncbi:MAG: DUF983 domain-containing protein [Cytophagaceae bacterium]